MVNYQYGQIYYMEFNGVYYIGSTTQKKLSTRICNHRADYKRYINGKTKSYCYSFKILELELKPNYDTIEFYECDNKHELEKRERHYIELYKEKYGDKCVNKCIPTRTQKEWYNNWYINNKEQKIEYGKNYSKNNRDKINKYRRENETDKKYRENNRDKINERRRQNRLLNKDKINAQQRERYLKKKQQLNLE